MLIECGFCGAPINVKATAKQAKCRYCATVDEPERLRPIAAETPRGFKPPKKWKPPATSSAGSSLELDYDPPVSLREVLPVSIALLVVMFGAAFLAGWRGWNTKPASLEHLSPVGLHKDVAKRLGGKASKTEVDVELNSDRYYQLAIHYPSESDPVPYWMSLELREDRKPDDAVRDHLTRLLNGGLERNGDWSWDKVQVSVSRTAINVSVDKDSTVREPRIVALWTLLLGAAFDPALKPTDDEMRRYLGGGYTVADLLKLPATTPIHEAKAAVLALFPGALIESGRRMNAKIAIDHPTFRTVDIEWVVAPGGTMESVSFAPKAGYVARKKALAACLTTTLGKPSETVDDPIEDTRSYTFYPDNAWLEMSAGATVHAWGPHNIPVPMKASTWEAVVKGIDGCRG
jgi:hypothetical protein